MPPPNPLQAQNPNPPNSEPLEPQPADPNAPPPDDAAEDADDDEEGEEPAQPTGDPAAAIRAERGRRKALAKKLKVAEQAIAQMKPLADEYSTLLPHLPTIMEHAKRGRTMQPQPQGPDPVEVQRLTEVAEAFGFTNDEGEPDLARASKVNRFVDALVKQRAGETVAPFAGQTAQMAAASMKEKAYKATDNTGRLYAKKEYIDHVFSNIAPEALSGQHGNAVAQQALVMARGLGGPGEDPEDGTEPVFTERAGRRVNGLPNLTASDHRLRQLRGKSEKDWATLMKDDPNQTGDWSLE